MRKNILKESKTELGKVVREIRFKKDLTQKEFGDLIGVKNKTVSGYETGNQVPLDAVLQKLSNLDSVSFEELLKLKKRAKDINTEPVSVKEIPTKKMTVEELRKLLTTFPRSLINEILGLDVLNEKENNIKVNVESFQNKLCELQNDWFLGSTKVDSLNYNYLISEHEGEFNINRKIGVVFTTPTINFASADIIEKVLGSATVLLQESKKDSAVPHNFVYVWVNPVLSLVEQFEILKTNYNLNNIVHFQNNHLKTYSEFHDSK